MNFQSQIADGVLNNSDPGGLNVSIVTYSVTSGIIVHSTGTTGSLLANVNAPMITIPGQAIRNCEGLTRREWLRIGGLAGIGGLGIGVADQLAARALGAHGDRQVSFGRAKSCIVLFMFGAPAHQDTVWSGVFVVSPTRGSRSSSGDGQLGAR